MNEGKQNGAVYHFGVSNPRGFGGGDAKHYWLQTDNLLERGTIDLTEWANAQMAADGISDNPLSATIG